MKGQKLDNQLAGKIVSLLIFFLYCAHGCPASALPLPLPHTFHPQPFPMGWE